MALTLLEAAKSYEGTLRESTLIEVYARSTPITELLGFESIAGNAFAYTTEHVLPGVGFRQVNAGFSESTGIINPQTEVLKIAGGDLDVDRFITETMGQGQRDRQERMKMKSLSLAWTRNFFKGDSRLDPAAFDGIEVRLGGNQVVANGNAGLKLTSLDAAIDAVSDPNAIFVNSRLMTLYSQAVRAGVAGSVGFDLNEIGRRVTTYNGIPMYEIKEDENDAPILGFTEAGATTSLYVVSLGEGKIQGIQNGTISVRDLGEMMEKPVYRTRVEWFCGIAVMHGRAAARLSGITNAAFTAS